MPPVDDAKAQQIAEVFRTSHPDLWKEWHRRLNISPDSIKEEEEHGRLLTESNGRVCVYLVQDGFADNNVRALDIVDAMRDICRRCSFSEGDI